MGREAAPAPAPTPSSAPDKPAAHVVLLASPGAGHVLPMAELARRVVTHGDGAEFTATLVTYTNFSAAEHSFTTLPASVSTAVLPEVALDDLPGDARIETRILTVIKRALPHVRDLLRSLLAAPAGVAAFVPDVFGSWALEVSAELGIPGYMFSTTNLTAMHSIIHMPQLDKATDVEFRDLPEPIRLPGCVPLRGADLADPFQDRANPVYPLVLELGNKCLLADGFMVNTFDAMEHETIAAFNALSREQGVYPPAYAVGPFVRTCSAGGEAEAAGAEHGCLRWLDEQPDRSVLYVCFGSGGTLSGEQMAELAAGLEASGQRFLWVVRFPSDKDRCASFFGSGGHGDGDGNDSPLGYLPEGFVERTRTRGVGLCVPLWAPQVEVLNHGAIAGFLSHCGWNSTLEAVAAGVPLLAWPLYAEQRTNAVLLSERVGIALALRPRDGNDDGVVSREEVAAAVTELVAEAKGAAAREKARELREAAAEAWGQEGPSRLAFQAVVAHRPIISSSCLLHWAIGCSAGSPRQLAFPPPDARDEAEGKQPGQDHELPFLGWGVRACFPAGAVDRFHQAIPRGRGGRRGRAGVRAGQGWASPRPAAGGTGECGSRRWCARRPGGAERTSARGRAGRPRGRRPAARASGGRRVDARGKGGRPGRRPPRPAWRKPRPRQKLDSAKARFAPPRLQRISRSFRAKDERHKIWVTV